MALSRTSKVWLAAYAGVSVVDVVAEAVFARVLAFVAVLLAMPALMAFLDRSKPSRDRFYRWVMAALFFSWLGDWLGDLIAPHVLVKIGFFFLGHLCFIAAFWRYRHRSVLHRPLVVVAYVVVIGGLIGWIAPHGGAIAPAIVGYGVVLGTMALLSTGVNRATGLGGALFVVSDLSIAITVFVFPGRVDHAEVIIMSTYLVAQLLIVLGAVHAPRVRALRQGEARAERSPARD
jgi:uncharacterized membrane protein YhhN